MKITKLKDINIPIQILVTKIEKKSGTSLTPIITARIYVRTPKRLSYVGYVDAMLPNKEELVKEIKSAIFNKLQDNDGIIVEL